MKNMRPDLTLALSILLITSSSFAALATDADTAVLFFRSPQSLFPSGQTSRNELQTKLQRTEMDVSYKVSWDKKEYQLTGDQILRDVQLSEHVETKSSCKLLALNRADAPALKTLNAKTTLKVVETESYWARVIEEKSKTEGWLPLQVLQGRNDDTGVFVNVIDTYLRKEPIIPSPVLTTIPRMRRIVPLAYAKGFLKVKYENQVGYADINHFVSRADFANLAYHPKKGWIAVSYRSNEYLVTPKGEQIAMNEIWGYANNPHRGIIVRAEENYGPQLRSRVEILKPEANIWGISRLDGHGNVWWKKSNLLFDEGATSSTSITTDQLMKREIYSIAFESKTSLRGLVSSEGVYRTEDGQTWTLITQFGKKNYPVNIHPNGQWFAGSYMSTNKGKSFEPFIRWDLIAQAIEATTHRNPRVLRLTQIESLPNSRLQIYVDTGVTKVRLRSNLSGARWDVITN